MHFILFFTMQPSQLKIPYETIKLYQCWELLAKILANNYHKYRLLAIYNNNTSCSTRKKDIYVLYETPMKREELYIQYIDDFDEKKRIFVSFTFVKMIKFWCIAMYSRKSRFIQKIILRVFIEKWSSLRSGMIIKL